MRRLVPLIGLVLVLAGGCFVTTLSLGSPADAKVDPAFCGDWRLTWKEGDDSESADMVVRNFDGRQYYIHWKPESEKAVHLSGFLVALKDATFVQCSELSTEAAPAEKHLIARVRIDGRKLTLRHLNPEFFNDVKTDAELRKKIEENLNNNEMYGQVMTGSLATSQ